MNKTAVILKLSLVLLASTMLPTEAGAAEFVTNAPPKWPHLAEVRRKWDPQRLEDVAKAAETGDLTAQHYMGFCYAEGHRVQTNGTLAASWYKRAAAGGYAPSINNMGVMYQKGRVVPKNYALAFELYKKAADMGMVPAQLHVGYSYRDGIGVRIDLLEALKWFQKAAEMGNADAMWQLYFAYRDGRGVSADKTNAAAWLRKSAEAGHPIAQVRFGSSQTQSSFEGQPEIRGFRNMPEAVRWYRLSAEQGCSAGQLRLATCYLDGRGVEKDEVKGLELVRLAVDQGDTSACFTLATLYSRGIGEPRSPSEEPISLFKRLIEKGKESPDSETLEACRAAFFRYQYGVGVERDLVAAAEMFCEGVRQGDWRHSLKDKLQHTAPRNRSEDAGCFIASPELSILCMRYPDISGLSEEFRLVLSHYLRAAKSDSASMVEIAHRYRTGDGVPENHSKAWIWLRLAQQNGNSQVAADINSIEQSLSVAELDSARNSLPEQTTKLRGAIEALDNAPETDQSPAFR